MAERIPDETLHTIRDRISLVEVVSSYVSLKKAGRNHLGLCPFHTEKTPSFSVNEERGLFHCFGCGVGGDVFKFLMRIERLEFPEAVEQLAKRAGVTLPKRSADGPGAALRERLYAVNAHAARFFQQALRGPGGAEARRYLAERGLGDAIAERYGLGFAPASGGALGNWLAQQRVPFELATQLGLLGCRDDGSRYDRFRGRIMFPIRDRRDRIIAFGGRTLGADQPKYLNSPESPLFHKGEGLYGLAEARDAIRTSERVVLVEGYMDVLLLVQEGIPYTVAVLGTALTAAQLRLLRPFGGDAATVYFFFDGDTAGQNAAERAFGICADAEVWGKAVFLPPGFDPDSYIRRHGAAATAALLDAAVPLPDFYFDRVAPPGASLPQRTRAAEDVARVLARIRNDVQFELLAGQAATRFGVSEALFRRARTATAGQAAVPAAVRASKWPPAELQLIEVMASDRRAATWVEARGTLALLADPELAAAGQRIVEAWEERGEVRPAIETLSDVLASRLTAILLGGGPLSEADRMKVAEDCALQIERRAQREQRLAMAADLRRAESSGDEECSTAKLARLNELLRREGGAA